MKKLGSILTAQQFDIKTLNTIFAAADKMRGGEFSPDDLRGKIMASMYYEKDELTRICFESAMLRLGGEVTGNTKELSSVAKGESLEDTIKVLSSYVDVIVLKYNERDGALRAGKVSKVPVINAGHAGEQGPIESLLGLYTETYDRKNTERHKNGLYIRMALLKMMLIGY